MLPNSNSASNISAYSEEDLDAEILKLEAEAQALKSKNESFKD